MPLNVLLTVVSSTPLHRSAIVYRAQDDALCQHTVSSFRSGPYPDPTVSTLSLRLLSYSTICTHLLDHEIYLQVHIRPVVADVVLLELRKELFHFCSRFISSRSSVEWATLFMTAEFGHCPVLILASQLLFDIDCFACLIRTLRNRALKCHHTTYTCILLWDPVLMISIPHYSLETSCSPLIHP